MLTDTVQVVLLMLRELISYSRSGDSHKKAVIFIVLSLDLSTVPWNTSSNVD